MDKQSRTDIKLEITYCIYNSAITEEYINEYFDYLVSLLPPKFVYYDSISKQWILLLAAIKYNLCVVDVDNSLVLFSYSINKLTNKIGSFFVKNTTINMLSNILKLYSFNCPIVLLSVKRTIEEGTDKLITKQRTYKMELINTINKSFVLEELIVYSISCLSNGLKIIGTLYVVSWLMFFFVWYHKRQIQESALKLSPLAINGVK